MKSHARGIAARAFGGLFALGLASAAQADCISLGSGPAYAQDFNTLAASGTSTALPSGWVLRETGTNANGVYTAGTGSGNAGDSYSFGAAAAAERALGGIRSGSLVPSMGACFSNNTGAAISALDIAYVGEEWRLGTLARGSDRLDFQYSLNATSLADGTWVDLDALDFVTPNLTGASVGARDGNAAAFRTALSTTLDALSIPAGATIWIRWNDFDASGADDGLAIDDFSLAVHGAAGGAPVLDVGDTSADEGDSGTTPLFFSFNLCKPAGAAGVVVE
jgi:hypothetical protein